MRVFWPLALMLGASTALATLHVFWRSGWSWHGVRSAFDLFVREQRRWSLPKRVLVSYSPLLAWTLTAVFFGVYRLSWLSGLWFFLVGLPISASRSLLQPRAAERRVARRQRESTSQPR